MGKNIDISRLPSDDGLNLLAKVLPYIDDILHDDDYNRLKERMKSNKELTMSDIMADAYNVIAMKKRGSLYGIVAAATGRDEDEVAAQPLEETLSVFQGVMGSGMLNFFIFCARTAARL